MRLPHAELYACPTDHLAGFAPTTAGNSPVPGHVFGVGNKKGAVRHVADCTFAFCAECIVY